jgi:DNA-binding LacI/PurR family transcriptional regulator
MNTSPTSIAKAYGHLRILLSRTAGAPPARLPSVKQLSVEIHISPVHICKALQRLSKEGRLTIIKGRGIFAGKIERPIEGPRPSKWEKVRMRLERDILDGCFGDGELPRASDLSVRYGACFQVIKKAIEQLVSDKLIAHHRKKYRIEPPYLHERKFSAILFIGFGYPGGKIVMLNERFEEATRTLQNECARAGVGFEMRGVPDSADPRQSAVLRGGNEYIGYIVWPNGMSAQSSREILSELARLKKPVAVIDEMGNYEMPEPASRARNVLKISIAGHSAGRQIGAYLLSRGHRTIGYFSLYHDHQWSRDRMQGIAEAFRGAGFDNALVPFVSLSFQEVHAPSDKIIPRLVDNLTVTLTRRNVKNILEKYEPAIANMRFSFGSILDQESILASCDAIFGEQVRRKKISALVAANDHTAIPVLHYLAEKGLSVPRDISAVSFDDTQAASQYNLTSYNFMFSGMARNAFSFIIYPSSRFYRSSWPRLEYEGIIVERESSGKRHSLRQTP